MTIVITTSGELQVHGNMDKEQRETSERKNYWWPIATRRVTVELREKTTIFA